MIGDVRSSFSRFARELRALEGKPKATFHPIKKVPDWADYWVFVQDPGEKID